MATPLSSTIQRDGSANSFQGRRLNRTNDVVVKSDGAIYFTDPRPQRTGGISRTRNFSAIASRKTRSNAQAWQNSNAKDSRRHFSQPLSTTLRQRTFARRSRASRSGFDALRLGHRQAEGHGHAHRHGQGQSPPTRRHRRAP